MPLSTLKELLIQQVDELQAGDRHALEVMTKIAKVSNSPDLGKSLRTRADQARDRVTRLDRVLKELNASPKRTETKGMKGLLEDCLRLAEAARTEPHVRDAALIAVAQHAIHDEIAGLGCARTWSSLLGLDKVAGDLGRMLQDARDGDVELTRIAERLNREAIAPVAV